MPIPGMDACGDIADGVVTRIYENIKSNPLKKKIAACYDLPAPVFTSWLTVITLTRNSCCHHARVWNRQYAVNPMVARKMKRPWISDAVPPHRTFYEICIIKWFVDIISPGNDMRQHFQKLLGQYPNVDGKAMGIPPELAGRTFVENIKSTFHLYPFLGKE